MSQDIPKFNLACVLFGTAHNASVTTVQYDYLRTTFTNANYVPVQLYSVRTIVPYPVVTDANFLFFVSLADRHTTLLP